ncbi:unnamed protein product [Cunninghamella echinulata]
MRAFKRQKLKPIPYNPYFISTKTQRNLNQLKTTVEIPELTLEEKKYVNESIRSFLKRELNEEMAYINSHQPKVKKRMHALNDRHNCDYCYTSIFNLYFMCGICGKELCKNCYRFNWEIKKKDELDRLTSCSTLYQQHHTKLSFVPVTKYNQVDIEKLHDQCNNSTSILLDENTIANSTSTKTTFESNTSTELTLDQSLLVISNQELTNEIFQLHWKTGKPVIVKDCLSKSDINWTPDYFCTNYGNENIEAINCHNLKDVKEMTVNDFFKNYSLESQDQHAPILKIKDWPSQSDFKEQFPQLYDDFKKIVPASDYSTPDGKFNLSNRLPSSYLKPDLGPKMFIAYGIGNDNTTGSTNLHCDMTDAVNVMCHAYQPSLLPSSTSSTIVVSSSFSSELTSPLLSESDHTSFELTSPSSESTPVLSSSSSSSSTTSTMKKYHKWNIKSISCPARNQSAAVWDIFAYEDLPTLREFLSTLWEEHKKQKGEDTIASHLKDPLHAQWIYLTDDLLNRLFNEYGIAPWRIYQCIGDAIFIPAGCAHQVANNQSAIKCAVDFISPENVERSGDITKQLADAKFEDVLQLTNTIVFTWLSTY